MTLATQFTPSDAPQGDFAEMDAQLFGADAPATQQQAETPEATPVAQPQQVTPDPMTARIERLENTLTSGLRQMRSLISQGTAVPESLIRTVAEIQQQLADEREEREMQGLTLEEQNAKLREKAAAKNAPAEPAQELQITRQEPWFIQGLTDEYTEDIIPELREMAQEDFGITLTADQLENIRRHALSGDNAVPVVYENGRPYLAWDRWLLKVIRPSLRQEAQRQAAEAKAAPQRTSPARATPAALGNGPRGTAGGTPQLDFTKSSLSDEISAAPEWGRY